MFKVPKIRVVTPAPKPYGMVETEGSLVYIDGKQLDGVTLCEVIGGVGELWKVRLTINADIEFVSESGGGG